MITLIDFDSEIILAREEAESLKLTYNAVPKDEVVIKGDQLKIKRSDKIRHVDTELRGDTHYLVGTDEEVSSYYLCDALPDLQKDTEWVKAHKQQLVVLAKFCLVCKYRPHT